MLDEEVCKLLLGQTEADILVVQAPPRHGKSQHISRWTPTWFLGANPTKRVMLATYGDSLSRKHGRFVRDTLQDVGGWFPNWHGMSADVSGAADWETAAGGGMLSTGVGGPLTGRGADLLIIDDPLKNAEQAISETIREAQWDWLHSTALTRLEPGGKVLIMMTRWHKDDLVGKLLEADADSLGGMSVDVLNMPAIAEEDCQLGRNEGEPLWPGRWPLEVLEKRKGSMPLYWWLAMYQQRPTQWGRMEWDESHFSPDMWVTESDWPDTFSHKVIASDPSKGKQAEARKGDYAAHVFLGLSGGRLWVDSDIGRWATTGLCEHLVELFMKRGANRVGIEENAWQDLLGPEVERVQRRTDGCPPLPISTINNAVNKVLRIQRLGPLLARGAFRFLDTPSNRLLVSMLREFPLAKYDDGPDALEMAVRLINHVAKQNR